MKFNTDCLHAGYRPGNGEPRNIPIIQSTTFRYETSEAMGQLFDLEASGYFYTRLQNPTSDAVAARLCALEGGTAAMLLSSGQAASFFAVFNIASAGDHVVASSTIYGGTYNLFAVTMKRMGIEFTFVDPDCTEDELRAAFRPNTKALFGETIANPALTVLDIEKFAKAAHENGVPLIVDNTFPTPIGCRPFDFGADIVTHSTTKYMDGHGAAVGGAIVDSGKFDWMANAGKFRGPLCAAIPRLSTTAGAMLKTTIAFTVQSGSDAYNVIPQEAFVGANMRFIPHQGEKESLEIVRKLADKHGLEMEVIHSNDYTESVDIDGAAFKQIESVISKTFPGLPVSPYVMTGATDAQFYQPVCKNCIRFAPVIFGAEQLAGMHGLNENIEYNCLPGAVSFYKNLIRTQEDR